MDIAALRRYCRLNKLKPSSRSHDDLVAVATKHWQGVNAKEVDSVAYFLFAVKHRRMLTTNVLFVASAISVREKEPFF